MTHWIKVDDFPGLLQPGKRVFIQGTASEPSALLQALANCGSACNGVEFIFPVIPGVNCTDPALFGETSSAVSFFITPQNRLSVEQQRTRILPLHYSDTYRYIEQTSPIDIALIQVSPPDERGLCSLGISADFTPLVVEKAQILVAEINPQMPAPPGGKTISIDAIDYAVQVDHPPIYLATSTIDADSKTIAAHVASLIKNGSTLELGIGRIPDAVLEALYDHRDIGIHSGMIADSVVGLIEAGVVNGAMKTLDKGKVVTGMALGSKKLYDFVGSCPDIELQPVCYTHSQSILGAIDQFVAINSAYQVDLFGQINSEQMGGKLTGGKGGVVDFVRGAKSSRGGFSIIALNATARAGTLSRIVPVFPSGQVVTVGRGDIDFVVTEYGIADLRFSTIQESGRALIQCAAPQFRDELSHAWSKVAG